MEELKKIGSAALALLFIVTIVPASVTAAGAVDSPAANKTDTKGSIVSHFNVSDETSQFSQGLGQKVSEYIMDTVRMRNALRQGNATQVGELVRARVRELIQNRGRITAQTKAASVKNAGLKKGLEMKAAIEALQEEGENTTELEEVEDEFEGTLEDLEDAEDDDEVQNKTQKMQQLVEHFREKLAKHEEKREQIRAKIAEKLQEHKNATDELDDAALADAQLTGAALIDEELEIVENASEKLKGKSEITAYLNQLRQRKMEMLNSTDKNQTRMIVREIKQLRTQMREKLREKQEEGAKERINATLQRASGMFNTLDGIVEKLKGKGVDTSELEATIAGIRHSLEQAEGKYGEHVSEAARYMNTARQQLQQFKQQLRETVQEHRDELGDESG